MLTPQDLLIVGAVVLFVAVILLVIDVYRRVKLILTRSPLDEEEEDMDPDAVQQVWDVDDFPH